MPFGVSLEVSGRRKIAKALKKLPDRMRKFTLVKALSAGAGVIKQAAIIRAPRQTGLLAKSLRVKRVKSGKRDVVAYRVQPRTKAKRAIARNKQGALRAVGAKRAAKLLSQGESLKYRDPVSYAHLVELGHDLKRGGHKYGHVRPHKFLSVALRTRERAARAAIYRKIREALAKVKAR